MNQLLFRADGNAQIGLGHVMRCLALADMLQGDFLMRFALIEPSSDVRALIEKAGIAIIELLGANAERAFLDHIHPDTIVMLDGYAFDDAFQQAVRERAKKLVFIDDLAEGHQIADVVINHAGGVTETDYDAEPYTQFYLGPHYALLRPEFLKPIGFDAPLTDGPIFVSFGGADAGNVSLTALKAIQQVDAHLPVHLILGPFHPGRAAIDAFQSQLPNLTIRQNLTAAQMVDALQQCNLAITACSTIAYEVCAINRPLITVVTADNQARLAQFLSEEKLALSVNFPTLLTRLTPVISLETMLKLAIQGFQFSPDTVAESLASQRCVFDGRSPERLRELFVGLLG
jgi:UDP-2,4-diacetamido-2,4,6-trideoxy-beta-L-altropyranose hydrolase